MSADFAPRPPILVTGSHRSGSTWVGRLLAAAPEVGYIHEPFNLDVRRPGVCAASFKHWFEHVPAGTAGSYRWALADTLAFRYRYGAALRAVRSARDLLRLLHDAAAFARYRWADRRPLLKDPLALLSAQWLAETFDMTVVVLVRHPAAFVSSLERLGWRIPFDHLAAQPALLEGLLEPYADQIRAAAAAPPPALDQAALLWKVLHHAIAVYRQRRPEWIFLRHEDLSGDPLPAFESLYGRLGLAFSDRVRRAVWYSTNAGNPRERAPGDPHATLLDSRANAYRWRSRLRPEEVSRIHELTAPYGEIFYADDEW